MKRWVFPVAAAAGVALSVDVASGRPILGSRWTLLVRLAAWAVAWLVAVWAAPDRRIVILGVALAVRVAALAGPPTTSDDLYRYAWDGRLQAAGVDPYRFAPAAAPLRFRDPWLWPDPSGCARLHRPPGCTRINRPTARTIYPPVAEAWFTAVHTIDGGDRHKPWQAAGLVVDLATVALLLRRVRPRAAAWYALSPLPVLEFVNNAHVDGLAVLLLVAAFVASSSRSRERWFGVVVAAAALIKVYPALLLLAARRRVWAVVSAAGLVVVAYLPHVVVVGVHVIGYLPGYLREEHYRTGTRFLLAGAFGVHGSVAGAVSASFVAAALAWVVVRRPSPSRAAVLLLTALFAATTPVQPWYAVSLVPLGVLAGVPFVSALAVAGYPYFFAVILDYRHPVGLGRLVYAVGVLIALGAQVRQIQRPAAIEVAVAGGASPGREHGMEVTGHVAERLEPPG